MTNCLDILQKVDPISFKWDEKKTLIAKEKRKYVELEDEYETDADREDGKLKKELVITPARYLVKPDEEVKISLDAASVQKAQPLAVKVSKIKNDEVGNNREVRTVDNSAMLAIAIGAIQELSKKYDDVSNKYEKLLERLG